jgi:hypothetical protein
MKITISLTNLPIYLDGGDGSLWAARDAWEIMITEEVADVSARRFVRVSDMLAVLRNSGIEVVYQDVVS